MRRIWFIAVREFLATVLTPGFIIGLLVVPALIGVGALAGPRIIGDRSTAVRGQIAVLDPTGSVMARLENSVGRERLAARRDEQTRRALQRAPRAVRGIAETSGSDVINARLGALPELEVVAAPPEIGGPDPTAWLLQPPDGGPRRVAIVIVQPDAVAPPPGRPYGSYDLYIAASGSDAEGVIRDSIREALVDARAAARHLDAGSVRDLVTVREPDAVTVSRGNSSPDAGLNRLLPMVFVGILMFSTIISGQRLLTSTAEEKSSRVVEVLLSAVSPFELMAGKILGHMAISALVLSLFVAVGGAVLVSLALLGLVTPSLVFYLAIFFVITYLVLGSLMLAIGSAVNDISEAQSLMMPIMFVTVLPWVLAPGIARAPNAPLSILFSFVPPVNTFGMLLRLASATPPPAWQVWTTIAIGVASAVGAIWFASKVFRIGLLMYGKPPNIATLIRWARMA